ncbi:MAG: hypothetical protein L0958_01710 [Candidatus Mariimomonas ferrooxydans]
MLNRLKKRLISFIENYSAGIKQGLVFAAVLLHAQRIILIDKSTICLDPRGLIMLNSLLNEPINEPT